MKLLAIGALLCAAVIVPGGGGAQELPHVFENGQIADADEVNANFEALLAESERLSALVVDLTSAVARLYGENMILELDFPHVVAPSSRFEMRGLVSAYGFSGLPEGEFDILVPSGFSIESCEFNAPFEGRIDVLGQGAVRIELQKIGLSLQTNAEALTCDVVASSVPGVYGFGCSCLIRGTRIDVR